MQWYHTIFKQKIIRTQSLSTGLNQADKLTLADGSVYFVKSQDKPNDLLIKEGKELALLSRFVNVPQVIFSDEYCLVLEYLQTNKDSISSAEVEPLTHQVKLGKILAHLHTQKMPFFGFEFDNKIGTTTQFNLTGKACENWSEFYWKYRLLPQINWAKSQLNSNLYQALLNLEVQLSTVLSADIKPVLLHGDLWSGNVLFVNSKPYLIDPACYYGHSEADLALTYMFGGFSTDFYQAYHQIHPKKDDFEARKYLYMLYHYLNHLNLFGQSYLSGVRQCLNQFS